mgnify:CR=1 FL=1
MLENISKSQLKMFKDEHALPVHRTSRPSRHEIIVSSELVDNEQKMML